MSLASSPDCLFRPEDKTFKALPPSVEDSTNTFDEYLNGDLYDHSDQDGNKELSQALTDYLERNQSVGNYTNFSPLVTPPRHQETVPQPWRKGLWCMNQNTAAAPGITIAKTRSATPQRRTSLKRTYDGSGKDVFSNSRPTPDILSSGTKRFMASPRTAILEKSTNAQQQPFSREVTLSPSPKYAQLQHNGRMAYQDSWQQDFQDFHLKLPEDGLVSPPVPGRTPHGQIYASQLNAVMTSQNGAAQLHHALQNTYAVSHQPRLAQNGYAAIDPSFLSSSQIGQAISNQSEEAVYISQDQGPHVLPAWTAENLESLDESQYSYKDLQGLEHAQLIQDHTWQAPASSMNPAPVLQQFPQHYYYPVIAQPTPHRPMHCLIQQPTTIHNEGLGIHFPLSAALSPPTNTYAVNPMQAYPPLPPAPTYSFTNDDPFSTPRRKRRQSSPLRSPSPCISPTNTTRTMRQRSPTHTASPTRHRRKSIGNAGPITHTAPPPLPKTPKTPRTPKTPTVNGMIDFVNYTPKDSAKLLSDVALSGSSKTRARREAEAKEKRKRLGEAAVKAVRSAGGDVRVLKAEGICLS